MQLRQLYKEVDIKVVAIDSATALLHKHHFYQLVYVLEGSGVHTIDGNRFPYDQGNVFLLSPGHSHSYLTDGKTKVCIIDFTKSLFSKNAAGNAEVKADFSDLFDQLEKIFHHQYHIQENLLPDSDKPLFDLLIHQIIAEADNEQSLSKAVIQNILFLLLNFIARNIVQQQVIPPHSAHLAGKTRDITAYIQQHIFNTNQLTIDALSSHFNSSPGNLRRNFKQQTGITLKDYITRCKLDIIQVRLKVSSLTISEIAAEMRFTDESHLNKVFKKAFGVTPTQFRKTVRNIRR